MEAIERTTAAELVFDVVVARACELSRSLVRSCRKEEKGGPYLLTWVRTLSRQFRVLTKGSAGRQKRCPMLSDVENVK